LIVAHDPSRNTLKLWQAVEQGAKHEDIENVEVTVLPPLEAGPDDVLACDAIILGTTENLGYMSGALKDFFDRSYYPCLEKTQGLPFTFISAPGSTAPVPTVPSTRLPLAYAGAWFRNHCSVMASIGMNSRSSAVSWGFIWQPVWMPACSRKS